SLKSCPCKRDGQVQIPTSCLFLTLIIILSSFLNIYRLSVFVWIWRIPIDRSTHQTLDDINTKA
ncbi:hypothetical protein ACJX0J_017616, partial [Zea mays]